MCWPIPFKSVNMSALRMKSFYVLWKCYCGRLTNFTSKINLVWRIVSIQKRLKAVSQSKQNGQRKSIEDFLLSFFRDTWTFIWLKLECICIIHRWLCCTMLKWLYTRQPVVTWCSVSSFEFIRGVLTDLTIIVHHNDHHGIFQMYLGISIKS